jgi:hypothetical protein
MNHFVPGGWPGVGAGCGRIQKAIRRCFAANDHQPVTTGQIRAYAFPRATHCQPSHCFSIRRALDRDGYRVVGDRRPGVPIKWAPSAKSSEVRHSNINDLDAK